MVPTFCEQVCASSRRHPELSGNASDGDPPLVCGEGGGLPNNESLSLMSYAYPNREIVRNFTVARACRSLIARRRTPYWSTGVSTYLSTEPTAWSDVLRHIYISFRHELCKLPMSYSKAVSYRIHQCSYFLKKSVGSSFSHRSPVAVVYKSMRSLYCPVGLPTCYVLLIRYVLCACEHDNSYDSTCSKYCLSFLLFLIR